MFLITISFSRLKTMKKLQSFKFTTISNTGVLRCAIARSENEILVACRLRWNEKNQNRMIVFSRKYHRWKKLAFNFWKIYFSGESNFASKNQYQIFIFSNCQTAKGNFRSPLEMRMFLSISRVRSWIKNLPRCYATHRVKRTWTCLRKTGTKHLPKVFVESFIEASTAADHVQR